CRQITNGLPGLSWLQRWSTRWPISIWNIPKLAKINLRNSPQRKRSCRASSVQPLPESVGFQFQSRSKVQYTKRCASTKFVLFGKQTDLAISHLDKANWPIYTRVKSIR